MCVKMIHSLSILEKFLCLHRDPARSYPHFDVSLLVINSIMIPLHCFNYIAWIILLCAMYMGDEVQLIPSIGIRVNFLLFLNHMISVKISFCHHACIPQILLLFLSSIRFWLALLMTTLLTPNRDIVLKKSLDVAYVLPLFPLGRWLWCHVFPNPSDGRQIIVVPCMFPLPAPSPVPSPFCHST